MGGGPGDRFERTVAGPGRRVKCGRAGARPARPLPSTRAPHRRPAISSLAAAIAATTPFAFDLALDYLRTSPSAVTEVIAEGAYHRAVRLGGRAVVVRLGNPSPQPPCPPTEPGAGFVPHSSGYQLEVRILGGGASAEQVPAAIALAEQVFATRADIKALEADVVRDPVFAGVAARFQGLRPVLIADPFEALAWAIIGQQINVTFAAKLKRALVERFGKTVRADGREFLLFPDPETLARLDHACDLRPIQFSRQKSEYTITAAREVAGGRLDFEALRRMPPDEALARLMQLKGVGRWTAEYVLMRGLGFPDVIPAADGGLRRIIGREYGLGRLATEDEVRALAARWAPWRSYAAFYWWYSLQREARERRETAKTPRRNEENER